MKSWWVRSIALGALIYGVAVGAVGRWVLMDQQRLAVEQVLVMAQDDLGNKYFGTSGGLTWVDKYDNYQIFTKENGNGSLSSDSITCLGVDQYRALWIGTDGRGLDVYDNGQWTHYTSDSTHGGLPSDGVLALALYHEEQWIGTRNGFAELHGNVWTTYTGADIAGRLPNPVVTAIAVDSSGNKWIGTIGGLVKFSGSSWTEYTTDNTQGGLPHNSITSLVVDSGGALWVGTQAGIARMGPDGKWTNFQGDSRLLDLSRELTYSLSLGASGDVWACIRGGVAHFSGTNLDLLTPDNTPGIMTKFVYYVMPGLVGEIWFATEKGVTAMFPPLPDPDENN